MADKKHLAELKSVAAAAAKQAVGQSKKGQGTAKARKRAEKGGDASQRSSNISAPVATGSVTRYRQGGMSDIRGHCIRYNAGFLYVGNGTVGASDQIYFAVGTNPTTVYTGYIPVAPADVVFGQSYVADLFKHYARKAIRRIVLRVNPFGLGTVTSGGISLVAAPYRGGDGVPVSTTGTTNATGYSVVQGMRDAQTFPAWRGCTIDMTPFIANAAGGKEFTIGRSAASSAGSIDQVNAIPCAMYFSGVNAVNGNRAQLIASVELEVIVDMLDFIGGVSQANPTGPALSGPADHKGDTDVSSPPPLLRGAVAVSGDWQLVEALDPSTRTLSAKYQNVRTGEVRSSLPQPSGQ